MGRTSRLAAVAAVCLGGAGFAVAQPPAVSGVYGGFASNYVPHEVWMRMLERPEDAPSSVTLSAPRDTVWAAVEAVFKQLDVPITFSDPKAGELGAVKSKLYRRLGKQLLSNYVRCGEGMTGPNAETYVVFLSVIGFLRPAPDGGTMLVTLVAGHAIDLPNGRNDIVHCTTTGRLEDRVAKEVTKRVKG